MGPTIKAGSRLANYFPDISKKTTDINDEGMNEPLVRTVSRAFNEGDTREIDGIQFWSASDQKNAELIAKRRLSLSMVER